MCSPRRTAWGLFRGLDVCRDSDREHTNIPRRITQGRGIEGLGVETGLPSLHLDLIKSDMHAIPSYALQMFGGDAKPLAARKGTAGSRSTIIK